MRIGIDTQTTYGRKTGFGFYVANLTENLQRIDKNNEYVFLHPKKKDDFSTPGRLFWDQVVLPRLAREAKVDILHQPGFSHPIFYRGKVVVTVHDLVAIFLGQNLQFWPRQYFARWVPFTFHYADHLIAVSEQTKRDTIRLLGIPEEKITVIYEAADERYQVITDKARLDAVRKKYKLCDEPIILHVGTLEPRKNLIFLIRAFAEAKKDKTFTAKLVITGKKGWYYQSIFKLVEGLELEDDVIFTGYVEDEDLPALYNIATLFAWPSQYEGFGLPPLEAMSCGLPVLSSNTSSMPEVIGDAGILLSPRNELNWAETMIDLLNNTQELAAMKQKGLAQAKKFSWEACAKATIAVYNRLAE